MYNQPPPQEAKDWHLGLVLEVCFQIGLGKPDSLEEPWEELAICEKLAKNQIRHWWKNPPKKKSTLRHYLKLVTNGELFSEEWSSIIEHAIKINHDQGKQRADVFEVEQFDRGALQTVILPKLRGMPQLEMRSVGKLESVVRNRWNSGWTKLSFFTQALSLSACLLLVLGLFNTLNPFHGSKYEFRSVFKDIKLCLEADFVYLPNNRCMIDKRTFTTNDPKIYLSFESTEPLHGLPEINLQWLRNGELLYERARPWIDAFAFDLKFASTHIKMQKFDYLPDDWAEPGLYHVRFYLNGRFVDEAEFTVLEHGYTD